MDVARLEHSPDLDRKGLATAVALVGAGPGALAAHLADAIRLIAARADRAIWPNPALYEGVSGFFVMEVRG